MSETDLVFASVPYANAVLVTDPIPDVCDHATVRCDLPAQLLERLLDEDADAALLPVVDYFEHDDLVVLADLGIAADGPVRSVLLKCRMPIESVVTVALDPASHTSNMLAGVLLRDRWHLSPLTVNEPAVADARVRIGDPALTEAVSHQDIDLAEVWKEMTGLPFVFAVWATRADHPRREELADVLKASLIEGRKRAPALAAKQAMRLSLSEEACLSYMTGTIHYTFGDAEKEAINLFAEKIGKPQR